MYDLKDLLQRSIEENASDVHFTVGKPPCYRIDGVLSAIEGERLMPDTLKELLLPIMEERHKEELKRDGQTDFAYAIAGVGRFRVNVFQQRGTLASVMRCLPLEIPEQPSPGIPKEVVEVTDRKRGLVLVTGPTGSGKSTTLASLLHVINQNILIILLHWRIRSSIFTGMTNPLSTSVRSEVIPEVMEQRSVRLYVKTRMSFWSERCETLRPFRLRSQRLRQDISYFRHCIRSERTKPSTELSMYFRRISSSRSASSLRQSSHAWFPSR